MILFKFNLDHVFQMLNYFCDKPRKIFLDAYDSNLMNLSQQS